MCPDELDRYTHKGCHTYSRLHVVREYEECSASRDNAAVQVHTDADASHSKLRNTSLEEGTCEVVSQKIVCILEESVGLVAVAEVG